MVHVSVGTANALCGALNAAREFVPVLFTAGRSPLLESGAPGARDVYIHWAQEMFDQAGMLREAVKWDYELRNGQQLETVVDRALTVAASEPKGPVYLSLPREVLGAPLPGFAYDSPLFAPHTDLLHGHDGGTNKTGTMEGVRTLTGYADTSSHGQVRFVISLASNDGEMRFRLLRAIESGL